MSDLFALDNKKCLIDISEKVLESSIKKGMPLSPNNFLSISL